VLSETRAAAATSAREEGRNRFPEMDFPPIWRSYWLAPNLSIDRPHDARLAIVQAPADNRPVNGVHDLGGTHGHGPSLTERDDEPFHAEWEIRVFALMNLCRRAGLFNLDEFRYTIERMPPAKYLEAGYYERWLTAVERLVQEKLQEKLAGGSTPQPRPKPPPDLPGPRWKPGDRVRTRNLNPKGHIRLPRYARAKTGVVQTVSGPWLLPDLNAELKTQVWQPVYTVAFTSRELWGEQGEERESVSLDLWEAYLEDG
jgi:hypothetical protein